VVEKGHFCNVSRLFEEAKKVKKEYSQQHPEKADTIFHLEN